MHSRKSILSRGIVFVLGLFAMMLFSYAKVSAVCDVKFKNNEQYITIGGKQDAYVDNSDIEFVSAGCGSNLKIDSTTVNGKIIDGSFSTKGLSAGHYTIGYNYSYGASGDQYGTIYRYIRILDGSYNTASNYNLANFGYENTSTVVDSFNLESSKYFVSFILEETPTADKTYLVVHDSLGNKKYSAEVRASSSSMKVVRVFKLDNMYYILGELESRGVMASYSVTYDDAQDKVNVSVSTGFDSRNITGNTRVYTNAYAYNNAGTHTVYLAGRDSDGNAIIDITTPLNGGTPSNVYTHDVAGAYTGITVVNGTLYAVGYTKDTNTAYAGLYTTINLSTSEKFHGEILSGETIFNDIAYDSATGKNIIVGQSKVNQIYANNALAAENNKAGWYDGIILQVNLDGTFISAAYMIGGAGDDDFTQIKNYQAGVYTVIGNLNDGTAGLTYNLTVDSDKFEAKADIVSANSIYTVNGIVSWANGYAYYGQLKDNKFFDVYYPKTLAATGDALFAVLDSRTISNVSELNLVKDGTVYKYCDYTINFNGSDYGSVECDNAQQNGEDFTLGDVGTSFNTTYKINDNTGVTIYIYRKVNVVGAPVPINLNSSSTGILGWHIYNRLYTTTSAGDRYETVNYSYYLKKGNTPATIEEMIEDYFNTGNTSGYAFSETGTGEPSEFVVAHQNSAVFANYETARKYAYYQEYSRVIKVTIPSGKTPLDYGIYTYPEQFISGNTFYVYYIDYKGSNSSDQVANCLVTATAIQNCSAKGGYAFAKLDSIKKVIEDFVVFNNFFLSSRNTIYNGSIPAAEIPEYREELTTQEYLKQVGFASVEGLKLNIEKDNDPGKTISLSGKTVVFGGKVTSTDPLMFYHSILGGNEEKNSVSVTEKMDITTGITYYESANYYFFPQNMCYNVYYSHNTNYGSNRVFCLDTKAPEIVYKKVGAESQSIQGNDTFLGHSIIQPLYVEADFRITDLLDLDEHAYIIVNGTRYTLACENTSAICKENADKYIRQAFQYNPDEPNAVRSITFMDRMQNDNTFYFVIGTPNAPSIKIENETKTGFTLVIDFYNTNPILSLSASAIAQACDGADDICYSPNADNPSFIDEIEEFETALLHYIYAVSYRDNVAGETEAVLTINQEEDGTFEINGVKYAIDSGYFVEVQSGSGGIRIDPDTNVFEYKGEIYSYNAATSMIYPVILIEDKDEEGNVISSYYDIDLSKESFPILDNTFQFEEDGLIYTIVEKEEDDLTVLYVATMPAKYPIESERYVEIGGVVYTINFTDGILTYDNPEISRKKHIEIEFTRTTKSGGGLIGGVDIPRTEVVKDGEQFVLDPVTGLQAYQIIEPTEENKVEPHHFNLTDGIYKFYIAQAFHPTIISVETKINVKPLEVKIGYALHHTSMNDLPSGVILDFDSEEDKIDEGTQTLTSIALRELGDGYRYPLDPTIVAFSNLSSYSDTNFVTMPIYVAYNNLVSLEETNTTTIFSIRVYDEKNSFGLPPIDNESACKQFVIYDNYSKTTDMIPDAFCSEIIYIPFSEISNHIELENYGIRNVFSSKGSFVFFGENMFYNISLVTYQKDKTGTYIQSSPETTSRFYIDSIGPGYDDLTDSYPPTIEGHVYDSATNNKVLDAEFELVDNAYILNQIIGSTKNVALKVNWYQGAVDDYRENKLLMMTVNGLSATCNLFQLINNPDYDTPCRTVIDTEKSVYDDYNGLFVLVFSASGVYDLTFKDAANNAISYTFTIDKTPPRVELIGASSDEGYLETEAVSNNGVMTYYVLKYVKNPSFQVNVIDVSPIRKICYYFNYGQIADLNPVHETYAQCIVLTESGNEDFDYVFRLSETALNELISAYADRDIVLTVWAEDVLGNGGSEYLIQVHFWVDYKAPEISYTSDNFNGSEIDLNNHEHLRNKTITINTNDYSGSTFACPEEGFSFKNATNDYKYTFTINCADFKDIEGTYPGNKGFANPLILRFYESSDGVNKGEMFNFSKPTENGQARWIYITVMDSIGNESTSNVDETKRAIVVPIVIWDTISPQISQVFHGEHLDIQLNAINYNGSNIYLTGTQVKVVMNEPIWKLESCKVIIGTHTQTLETTCDDALYGDGYTEGSVYTYLQMKMDFIFRGYEKENYKEIIFSVLDFSNNSSGQIRIVIDRLAPVIDFKEGQGEDDSIEYMGTSYYTTSYNPQTHVDALEDQRAAGLTFTYTYYRYLPSVTHKNYEKIGANQYQAVPDGKARNLNTKYYLLLKKEQVENKKCLSQLTVGGTTYCYVEDTQAYYYFDTFKEDVTGLIWKDNILQISSDTIGIYRISYTVKDYVGNTSGTIYKTVFVNDSVAPDIDIKDDSNNTLYKNVTSTNNNNFEGKLNRVVSFQGTEGGAASSKTRIVLYKCDIDAYENGSCIIDQPLFVDTTGKSFSRGESTGSLYSIGNSLSNGIYKAFVYDTGKYNKLADAALYHDGEEVEGGVYSLTHNTASVYFAVKKQKIDSVYTIYGNRYDGQCQFTSQNVKVDCIYSTTNYFSITNGSIASDVYLIKYNESMSSYTSSYGQYAIGYGGTLEVDDADTTVTYSYFDNKGNVIYQVKYRKYAVASGLMLHETYHKLDISQREAAACRIVNGRNECESLEYVYKVISVTATIYPDGEYRLKFMDRYGNISEINEYVNLIVVNNSYYLENKNNNHPTGINYWYSVPSEIISSTNYNYFSQVKDVPVNTDVQILDSKYNGNFNSQFFYAFASKEDALSYVKVMYQTALTQIKDSGSSLVLFNKDGTALIPEIDNAAIDVDNLINNEIASFLTSLVYPTYVGDNMSFSSGDIKQRDYDGNLISTTSSMYEYIYIKVTRTVNNHTGEVSYNYTLKGDSCTAVAMNNEECIRVNLQIISKDNRLAPKETSGVNEIACLVQGVSGDFGSCTFNVLTSGAKYIYIDTDYDKDGYYNHTVYHTNTVYFGYIAYSDEEVQIEYKQLGQYVPLSKFENRYNLVSGEYVADADGAYVWFNSKFELLNELMSTNLYTSSCTFDGDSYDTGCLYVTYLSRFADDMTPSSSDSARYYYNYYDGAFYLRQEIMALLGVDATFSPSGDKATGTNGNNVPIFITKTTAVDAFGAPQGMTSEQDYEFTKITNKKTYIKLFGNAIVDNIVNDNTAISRIFEVKVITQADEFGNITYKEVYSYASVRIKTADGSDKFYNLNGVDKNGNKFITISKDGKTYECNIDIVNETITTIIITDRAGNNLKISVSHSDITPTITYNKVDESKTNSDVDMKYFTTSTVAALNEYSRKIYKYNEESEIYEEFTNRACFENFTNGDNSYTTKFKYNANYSCSGIYRVAISDNFGNTKYTNFVFNPYDLTTSIAISGDRTYAYTENEVNGIIVGANVDVKLQINANINYLIMNKYASYSNLNLGEPQVTVAIKAFNGSTVPVGLCNVSIRLANEDYGIYTVTLKGSSSDPHHDCDGIYTIDLVNRYTEDFLTLSKYEEFRGYNGADTEIAIFSVPFEGTTAAGVNILSKTVEIDTIAPDTSEIDSDISQHFVLTIDDQTSIADTRALISSDNKTISYFNKYIKVSWGGYASYSLTYLKYRAAAEGGVQVSWQEKKDILQYSPGYVATHLFKMSETGTYIFEFMFTDIVGNENSDEIFTIRLTVEAPRIGFYETNQYGMYIGDKYEEMARIGDRTILRCEVDNGYGVYELTACTTSYFEYDITVSNQSTNYSVFVTDEKLREVISRNSSWVVGTPVAEDLLLEIKVTAYVKGKRDIKTTISIVIDNQPPEIKISGSKTLSTYKGAVSVSIDNHDETNRAQIYRCDYIDINGICFINNNGQLQSGRIEYAEIDNPNKTVTVDNSLSGYFLVIAYDDLGNTSLQWWLMDNDAPVIEAKSNGVEISQNMYTNTNAIFVTVTDELSQAGAKFNIEFKPLDEKDTTPIEYVDAIGLTREGKYILTPIDGVGNEGRSITFYIYRQKPVYQVVTSKQKEGAHQVDTEVSLTWKKQTNELVAPIVSITIDSAAYEAQLNAGEGKYYGKVINTVGDHVFVVTDAAGNKSVTMITINNTQKVCINGHALEVRMQANYNIDSLLIGKESDFEYQVDDVIIFALPSQSISQGCMEQGILGYRTLDPQNSYYHIDSDRNAMAFNNTESGIDFIQYRFISQKAIDEIKAVGGNVVVFVVTKDVANDLLGYNIGTHFFMEDPLGWSIIFSIPLLLFWPTVRIFVKKKVRVI